MTRKAKIHLVFRWLTPQKGNVIAYIAMVLVIFGVLGGIMASLLTSSVTSSATPNYSRRALYMTEAGMRYGLSELRNSEFATSVIDTLNTTTYTLNSSETFTLNIFGPWFNSSSYQDKTTGENLSLQVVKGEIPSGYTIPVGPQPISIVNLDYVTNITDTASAEIQGYTKTGDNTLDLTISDNFVSNEDEGVCFAVHPSSNQGPIALGGTIEVESQAQGIFPEHQGAIEINRNDYFYENLVVVGGHVELTNLSGMPESEWNFNVTTSDYVILSPRNYTLISTGQSETITAGGTLAEAVDTYDQYSVKPGTRKPDIDADDFTSNLSEIDPAGTNFFVTDLVKDELNIGGGYTPTETVFGAAWYDADKAIGGDRDFCQAGECLFGFGVRVFFLLDFFSQGDGITFALLNGANNNSGSVGGDIELSELMAYAGDSRLDADGTSFLDGTATGEGLKPPKLAVEFDTRTNNPTLAYCADANTINVNTRNDPFVGDKDAVQYVYWGNTILDLECRSGADNQSYDDNRHDSGGQNGTERWRFGAAGPISVWRPAIGTDGTIYMSALDANLYALNEDGTLKWTFSLGIPPGGNNDYMPGVDPNTGTIYSDISGNSIVAIDSNGNELWQFGVNSDIDSTPTVGPDGRVYFGTDFEQALYAIDPAARAAAMPFPQPNEWKFPTLGEVDNVPALNSDASVVYFVSKDNNLYAVNTADGTERWRFPILTEPNELDSSPTVDPTAGTIYVGSDDNNLYAINPDGTEKWRFTTGGEIESSAALDPVDGTIYIGSDDNKVWAVNPNGTEKWQFVTGNAVESSAIIGADGTILIGSLDGLFYAIGPDGTEKWNFPSGGQVPSSAAIGEDGIIYIGSNDNNFYAINQFAEPRNNKDLFLTPDELGLNVSVDDPDDWLNGDTLKGPWAVRLEVDRSTLPDAGGRYDYRLSLWIRQCQDLICSEIIGTAFQDTRLDYEYSAVADLPMTQQFELTADDHAKFDRFLFGFTGATGAGFTQNAFIEEFQLSFIRSGDQVISNDPQWPPP